MKALRLYLHWLAVCLAGVAIAGVFCAYVGVVAGWADGHNWSEALTLVVAFGPVVFIVPAALVLIDHYEQSH